MQSLAGSDKGLISLLVIHLSIHHLLIGTESLLCAGTLPSYEETVGPNADVPTLVYLGRQVLPKNSLAKSGLGGREGREDAWQVQERLRGRGIGIRETQMRQPRLSVPDLDLYPDS